MNASTVYTIHIRALKMWHAFDNRLMLQCRKVYKNWKQRKLYKTSCFTWKIADKKNKNTQHMTCAQAICLHIIILIIHKTEIYQTIIKYSVKSNGQFMLFSHHRVIWLSFGDISVCHMDRWTVKQRASLL